MARSPFLWGQGGRKMTPEQVDRERLVAQALLARGSDTSPVGHWTAALNRALQGVTGGLRDRRAGEAEDAGLAAAAERVAPFLGGSPTVTASSMGGSPVAAALAGGDFIDPVEGGVNFPASLIASESGGNWNALNSEGYGGRLQFGQARLADAARAGVIPMGLTGADFARMSPEEQMAVEQWHFADIDRQAQEMGLYDYLGQTIGGVKITPDAIRGMAHLGGIGGAAKFIKSGGAYNPSDSNGTSLRDYGIAHGGSGGVTASTMGGSPVASALMSGPSSQELLGLLADPWVARQYGPVLQALAGNAASREQAVFAQQLAQSDPMYQAELARLTAPQPVDPWAGIQVIGDVPYRIGPDGTAVPVEGVSPQAADQPTSVQEYLFYADQAAQAGQTPLPYDQWDMARKAAGATSVNVGGEGQRMGSIPAGMAAVPDPTNPSGFRLEPIPGGPAALEAEAAAATADRAGQNAATATEIVTSAAQRAREANKKRAVGGIFGQWATMNPSSENAELYRQVDVLKSNAKVENLNAMRAASPTGGALGSVTEKEADMLAAKSGALDPASPYFERDLADYELTLLRTVHGFEEGNRIFAELYPEGVGGVTAGTSAAPSAGGGTTINGYTIRPVN